jgi:hypothetical protein
LELEPFLVELLMADMPAPGILRDVNDDMMRRKEAINV